MSYLRNEAFHAKLSTDVYMPHQWKYVENLDEHMISQYWMNTCKRLQEFIQSPFQGTSFGLQEGGEIGL